MADADESGKGVSVNSRFGRSRKSYAKLFDDLESPGEHVSMAMSLRGYLEHEPSYGGELVPQRQVPHFKKWLSANDQAKLRRRLYQARRFPEESTLDPKERHEHLLRIKAEMENIRSHPCAMAERGLCHETFEVPEETAALMSGVTNMALRENIYYLQVHNGCRVRLHAPQESDGPYRKVTLSGSKQVVKLVAKRIRTLQKRQEDGDPSIRIRVPTVPVYSSVWTLRNKNLPVPLVRGYWDRDVRLAYREDFDEFLAGRPLNHVNEFLEHVVYLTNTRPYHRMWRKDEENEPTAPWDQRIADAMVALFQNDEHFRLISTAALNEALAFLYKREFLHHARQILAIAAHVATRDTYNLLLKEAAIRQNLRQFEATVFAMQRMQFEPDETSWVAFAEFVISPGWKASLIKHLTDRGSLALWSLPNVMHNVIEYTFETHLDEGENVDSFFRIMIERHNFNWFNPSLLNKMFAALVRRDDHAALDRLFTICLEHGLSITNEILITILGLFQRDIDAALGYFYTTCERGNFHITKELFEKLFFIAQACRCYNLSRVIWRYACMACATTRDMADTVRQSLRRTNGPVRRNVRTQLWLRNSGKVIVGVRRPQLEDEEAGDLLEEFRDKPLEYLLMKSTWTDPETRAHVARAIVRHDVLDGSKYRPIIPLLIALDAAHILDINWGTVRGHTWLVYNAMQVPTRLAEPHERSRAAPEGGARAASADESHAASESETRGAPADDG